MIAAAREYAIKEKVTVTTTQSALDLWFVELTTALGGTEMTAVCSQVKTNRYFLATRSTGACQLHQIVQGDPSGWLQPPVDLFPPSYLGSRAVCSYSSGPSASGTSPTLVNATGGCNHPDGSPCR